MRRLEDTINRQLYEAYPMSWLDEEFTETSEEATSKLYEAVRILHNVNNSPDKLDKFFEVVNKEDFETVKMWLTEVLHELLQKDKV